MAVFIKETDGKSAREISQVYVPNTNDQSERWIDLQTD